MNAFPTTILQSTKRIRLGTMLSWFFLVHILRRHLQEGKFAKVGSGLTMTVGKGGMGGLLSY